MSATAAAASASAGDQPTAAKLAAVANEGADRGAGSAGSAAGCGVGSARRAAGLGAAGSEPTVKWPLVHQPPVAHKRSCQAMVSPTAIPAARIAANVDHELPLEAGQGVQGALAPPPQWHATAGQ